MPKIKNKNNLRERLKKVVERNCQQKNCHFACELYEVKEEIGERSGKQDIGIVRLLVE